jgi:hypothetical protein
VRLRLLGLAALAAVTATCAITAATASAAPPARGSITAPITAAQSGNALNGVFNITSFATNTAGQLVANGTFTGTYTDPVTGAVQTITSAASSVVTNPAAATGGGCQILDLVLGPLHLDLLGLVVDLNQVHLNITAQPGPGNLLGNLLCSVSHLLDNTGGGGLNTAIQNLLNLLNGLLGGL